MKAYKRDLSNFYSTKKEQDDKLRKALSGSTFEEKKEIIAQHRATVLEQGVYSIDSTRRFDKIPYMRDIYYLEQLNENIKNMNTKFNEYKYDVLYELTDMDEAVYDKFELDLTKLKEDRANYIRAQADKLTAEAEYNDIYNLELKALMDSFNSAEKDEKKDIYTDIIQLKKSKFDRIKHLSMVKIDGLNTLVIDYLPIRYNQKKMLAFNLGEREEIVAEELEPNPNS